MMVESVLSSNDAELVGGNLKFKLAYNCAGKLQIDFLKDISSQGFISSTAL